jgi:two-component system cell cycle sensor histidine kinase/response regulator CckA
MVPNAVGEPGTVLIVEDERVVALYLQQTLRQLGYHVPATAASTADALSLAEKWPPRIVLMDLRLRAADDGIEAAKQLRAHFTFGLIYMAGSVDEDRQQRAAGTEPEAWLLKPFSPAQLEAALQAVELCLAARSR